MNRRLAITAITCLTLALIVARVDAEAIAIPCRVGVGAGEGIASYTTQQLARLRLCVYQEWKVQVHPPEPSGEQYLQLVNLRETTPHTYTVKYGWQQINDAALANPGSTWLIGNEPDCVYQNNLYPQTYAMAYHDLYSYIKLRDATAQVSAGGIVQATPARLAYLDIVLAEYQKLYNAPMPVDVWNIHNYVLSEDGTGWSTGVPRGVDIALAVHRIPQDTVNGDLAHEQLVTFRQWMASNGYQGKPLIVTEWGGLPTNYFDDDTVARFVITDSLHHMLNARDVNVGLASDDYRLVQGSLYFQLDPWTPYESLINFDGTLTTLGNSWAGYMNQSTTLLPLIGNAQ